MQPAKRNVIVLAICQGLLLINNTVLVTVNGLAGFALAPDKALATLPVTMYFVGSALTTIPLSFMMKRHGRRAGFTLGASLAMLGSLMCAFAVYRGNFWMLCFGVLVLGAYFAAAQYYRFAAADTAPAEFKATAISLVLAGGIVGGFLGPETSKRTIELFPGHLYAGAYISLVGFALISALVLRWLKIPALEDAERVSAGRPLAVIARQPAFIVAVLCGTIAYGVMNLLMTTTPLAMIACEHPFSDAAFVIQWHVVGMFAPSFVTGTLIKRFGRATIMLAGVALNVACVMIALAGVEVMHFWLAMLLLGIGWNFMFIGATSLLTETYTPAERAKVQGINDAAIFMTMVASSFSSGALFSLQGWEAMNRWALPVLAMAAAAVLWLGWTRRRTSPAA
jgi:MFS family permease